MFKRLSISIVILSIINFFLTGEILLAQQPTPDQPPAQEQPVPQPPEPAQPVQPTQPVPQLQQEVPLPQIQPPAIKQPLTRRGEVSFNFDDADIFSVIQTIFGEVLGVNYIVDPRVKGRVNFRSTAPVAKEDVLPLMEVILRLTGIGIVEEGGLYRIIPISEMPKEPAPVGIGRDSETVKITGTALLQVVPVHYIQSSEMVRILTPFLSQNALIVDIPKTNYIIIVDTDANIKRLLQLVEIFDSEHLKKIKPEVFVYPVQNSKAKDVANMLQQIFLGARPTTPAIPVKTPTTQPTPALQPPPSVEPEGGEALVSDITRIFPDEVTNSIIILATPDDYKIIADTITKIDIVPRQVMIEALVAEIKLTDDLTFGLAWSLRTRGVNFRGDIGFNTTKLPTLPMDPTTPFTSPSFTFLATDTTGDVRVLLDALASDSKLKVLASPHILVSDNREARIQIGDQVPIATSETNITGTTQIQRTIQYKDTGIILKVKPQVNESGLVALDITQEVSNFSLQKIFDSDQVIISKREAVTNLVAQDSQTIVIGGLIREDASKTKEGIPILSKIPILGYLFGSTTKKYTRTELVILLTPHVIRNQAEATNVTSGFIQKLNKNLSKDLQINE